MVRQMLLIALASSLFILAMACGSKSEAKGDAPAAVTYSASGYRLWLEAPKQARSGEPMALKLYVENITDRPVTVETGYYIYDFIAVTGQVPSIVVWGLHTYIGWPDVGPKEITLNPGEIKVFEGEWDQRRSEWDNKKGWVGEQVPLGDYFIYGALVRSLYPDIARYQLTEPQQVTITP